MNGWMGGQNHWKEKKLQIKNHLKDTIIIDIGKTMWINSNDNNEKFKLVHR